MIQLCTFTTLLPLQNNTSQKILSILARTIHSLGLCLKSVSIKFVAIVTSSIYFDVQKFSYLFENIYISNQLFFREYILRLWDTAGTSDNMRDNVYNDRNDCCDHKYHSNNEGTEEFEGLRVVCYEKADVFIVCYSLAKPASANNVRLPQ